MAIFKLDRIANPIFNKLQGKTKACEFRTRRNKAIEISARRIPKQPRTPAQQNVRKAYGRAVREWRALSKEKKEEYNERAKALKISGWNLFLKEWMEGAKYKVVLDATHIDQTLTNFVLQIYLDEIQDILNFLNDDLTNLKILDEDKKTQLKYFIASKKNQDIPPCIYVEIPVINNNSYKTIYLVADQINTHENYITTEIFDFFDHFEDPDLPQWTSYNDITTIVENSILKLTSSSGYGCLMTNTSFEQNVKVIAKIDKMKRDDLGKAIGFSDQCVDLEDLYPADIREYAWIPNDFWIHVRNKDNDEICSDYGKGISQTESTLLEFYSCDNYVKLKLNKETQSMSNQPCLTSNYSRKVYLATKYYEETTDYFEIDYIAVTKAYRVEPIIYLVEKIT